MSQRRVPFLSSFVRRLRRLENPFRDVPSPTLWRYRAEVAKTKAAAMAEVSRLDAVDALIQETMRDRERDRSETTGLVITDHAMIRYIERWTDVDLAPMIDAIRTMVEEGAPEVAVRNGTVITVLPRGVTSLEAAIAADVGMDAPDPIPPTRPQEEQCP